MSERYPILPELVFGVLALYFGLSGVAHRLGVATPSEIVAATIEERIRQQSEAMQDAPPPVPEVARRQDDRTPRLPAAIAEARPIPPEFLPEALREPKDIPTLQATLVEGALQIRYGGTLHSAATLLDRLRNEGVTEARIRLPASLLRDERLAVLVGEAMRDGIQFQVEVESRE